jgi:hypothetical protein
MPLPPGQLSIYLPPMVAATVVYPTQNDIQVIYDWTLFCLGVDGRDAGATLLDATVNPPDDGTAPSDTGASDAAAPIDVDAPPPPPGEAGFAFIVNGVVQTPLTCPSNNWEFWPVDSSGAALCNTATSSCSVASVVLENTGPAPMPYTAQPLWSSNVPPGIATGDTGQLVGVLAPGAQVDVSSAFNGGIVAILGSSLPFSQYDAHYVTDEGSIPWPGGLDGSQGSSLMWVAQIDLEPSCRVVASYW